MNLYCFRLLFFCSYTTCEILLINPAAKINPPTMVTLPSCKRKGLLVALNGGGESIFIFPTPTHSTPPATQAQHSAT